VQAFGNIESFQRPLELSSKLLLSRKQTIKITHGRLELMGASATNYRNKDIQTAVALALRNSAHTNIYNEAYALRLACHPNASSFI
jgi:hypothetical protein